MRKRRFLRLNRTLLIGAIFLFLLLVGGTYLYSGLRGEHLLGDFKAMVEKAASRAFRTKVTIGDVKGGIFYPVTFSDVDL